MSTLIYVEGGGRGKESLTACRRAFAEHFRKAMGNRPRPKVIACGDRASTYRDFCLEVRNNQTDTILLLVDSEDALAAGQTVWGFLTAREGWQRPAQTQADAAHLMVQSMESWFLSDPQLLKCFYGQGFLQSSLPAHENLEVVTKADVMRALEHASRHTQKGTYHKTRHGFAILEHLDPDKVRARSQQAARLYETLRR